MEENKLENLKINPYEKLGLDHKEMQQLLDKFKKYYSNPLYHKGVLWSEFEAFVVGYKLQTLEVEEIK